jgi:hypothetical protein
MWKRRKIENLRKRTFYSGWYLQPGLKVLLHGRTKRRPKTTFSLGSYHQLRLKVGSLVPVGGSNQNIRLFSLDWYHQSGLKVGSLVPVGGSNQNIRLFSLGWYHQSGLKVLGYIIGHFVLQKPFFLQYVANGDYFTSTSSSSRDDALRDDSPSEHAHIQLPTKLCTGA